MVVFLQLCPVVVVEVLVVLEVVERFRRVVVVVGEDVEERQRV